MTNGMKWSPWTSVCCIALLISGCAKRQTGISLVYVAASPPLTPPDSGMLVIEEHMGVQQLPFVGVRMPLGGPSIIPPTRKEQSRFASAEPQLEEGPLVEPPPLEPAKNVGQADRQKIEHTQDEVRARLREFRGSSTHHSPAEARTANEANAFLEQSEHALSEGDLPRAKNLADKALLLIKALEKGP
jgi:hypothetical protein